MILQIETRILYRHIWLFVRMCMCLCFSIRVSMCVHWTCVLRQEICHCMIVFWERCIRSVAIFWYWWTFSCLILLLWLVFMFACVFVFLFLLLFGLQWTFAFFLSTYIIQMTVNAIAVCCCAWRVQLKWSPQKENTSNNNTISSTAHRVELGTEHLQWLEIYSFSNSESHLPSHFCSIFLFLSCTRSFGSKAIIYDYFGIGFLKTQNLNPLKTLDISVPF